MNALPESRSAHLFVADLATRYCENSTARTGCIGDSDYDRPDRICTPCAARKVVGADEAPRRCDNCGAVVDIDGVDGTGGDTCPAPKHRPHLFYGERWDPSRG